MRRKDREMPTDFALSIVDKCEWAVVSCIDINNMPYCFPISIVRDGNNIYFHSAKNGYKIDSLRRSDCVCISCVGDTHRMTDEFTTEYESAIVRGVASEVLDDKEAIFALKLLCIRHIPANMDNFQTELDGSIGRTAVWKIKISEISGKRKKFGKDGIELKYGKMEDKLL